MRIRAHIMNLFRAEIGDALFDNLISIYGEGRSGSDGHVFESHLPAEDPRTLQILDVLHRSGFVWRSPSMRRSDFPGRCYDLRLEREYDQVELDGFALFEFRVPAEAGLYSVERKEDGRLRLAPVMLPDDLDLAYWDFFGNAALRTLIIAKSYVRDVLAANELKHLILDQLDGAVRSVDPQTSPSRSGTPSELFTEVTSDFVLPPLSPSVQLADDNMRLIWPGPETRCAIRVGGLYSWPELHYRTSDLRAIGSFDVAKTYESFWGGTNERNPDYCPLIVSKRFYDLCQQHGFKVDWLPVHIDPI